MKISLKNQKNALSRNQMRTVIGGNSEECNKCCVGTNCSICNDGTFCTEGEPKKCDASECTITFD